MSVFKLLLIKERLLNEGHKELDEYETLEKEEERKQMPQSSSNTETADSRVSLVIDFEIIFFQTNKVMAPKYFQNPDSHQDQLLAMITALNGGDRSALNLFLPQGKTID